MGSLGGYGMYIGNSSGGGGGLPPDGVYGQITVSGSGTVWVINQTADVNIGTYQFVGSAMKADSSAGGYLLSNSGTQAMQWGAGGGQNVTFYDGVKLDAKTASRIVTTDSSKNLATDLSLTTDGTLSANSDTNVPSEKAVKTYADSKVAQTITNGVTTSAPSQDAVFDALAGKEPILGYTPEDVANKSTNTSLGTSNTLYPTQNAVKTYVDARSGQAAFIEVEKNIATNIIIDAENEKISIVLKECLVSPTGIVMKVLKETQYERFNTVDNKRYDNLEESEIGQGIKQMVSGDLENYPNIGE